MHTLVFWLCVSTAVGLPHYDGNIRSDTEFVAIQHLYSEHGEVMKYTHHMPRRIVLKAELTNGSVVFNLTRSERDHHEIPVVVRHGENVITKDVLENYDQAVYKDQRLSAALMVERISTDKYKVAGTFYIGENPYNIWPERRHKRSVENSTVHAVSAQFNINFMGDALPNEVYWNRQPEFLKEMERLKGVKEDNGRQKRSNVQQHTIELCIFSDSADWMRFLTAAGGDATLAESNLRLFYANVVEAMNVRYANLPPDQVCVQVVVKGLDIFMAANTPSWIFNFINPDGSVNASAGIREMSGETAGTTGSATDQNAATTCDHYMLFTGRDLFASSQGMTFDISGVALQGAMCSAFSVSMVENTRDGSLCLVAAHELGHSLNSEHDVDAGCNDANGFIMATSFSTPSAANPGNFFRWSTCSATALTAFFNTLNTRNDNCALVENIPGGSVLVGDGSFAGQRVDADAQCARFMPGTRFCRVLAIFLQIDTICQRIGCSADTVTGARCEFLVPLDRTSCGDRRWCVQGVCVTDNAAPARPANCPQGDDPGVPCTPALCATEPFRCCETCAPPTTTVTSTTTMTTTSVTTAAPTTSSASTVSTTAATATTATTSVTTAAPTTSSASTVSTTAATATTATTSVTTAAPTTSSASTASTVSATTMTTTTTVATTPTTSVTTDSTTVTVGPILSVAVFTILSC